MNKKKLGLLLIIALVVVGLIKLFAGSDWDKAKSQKETTFDEALVTVDFIDIGQGDAELISLPQGKFMLIDAGDNGHEEELFKFLDQVGVKRIDFLIATHPHVDHIGGMPEVIKKYDIGEIYMPRIEATSKTFERMLDAIDEKNLTIHSAEAGKTIFDYDDVRADIISPQKGKKYEGLNNYSAVIELVCGDVKFLFMGDAEKDVEYELLENWKYGSFDVLKIAHHGSSSSSSIEFIKKVAPEYAVISCGKDNSYGHPHIETLKTLKAFGVTVFRTDELGTITIKTDGKQTVIN